MATATSALRRALPSERIAQGLALEIAAVLSLQLGNVVAQELFSRATPAGVGALRTAFGAAILMALARPRIRGLTRSQRLLVLAFGATVATNTLAFYEALSRLPLGVAVTVAFLGPLGVAISGFPSLRTIVWPLAAAVGVALTTGVYRGELLFPALGLAAGGVCACAWATYIVLGSRIGSVFPGIEGLALGLAVAGCILFPIGVAGSGTALFMPVTLALAMVVALLSIALGYSLEMFSLKRLPPHLFGIVACLEPVVAALLGALVLGQVLPLPAVTGIVLIVVACVGATWHTRRAPLAPRDPVVL